MSVSLYIIIGLAILLAISLFYNFKFALIILRVEDVIEESLDIIDEKYANISKILKIPLYYDSPEIRSVLRDVEQTREAILHIARVLSQVDPQLVTVDDTDAG